MLWRRLPRRFDRNPTTSGLAYEGCFTADTLTGPSGSGACSEIPSASEWAYHSGLQLPHSIPFSDDGKSLYAGLRRCHRPLRPRPIRRSPHLSRLHHRAHGCWSGGLGCVHPDSRREQVRRPLGPLAILPHSLAVSADGNSLYVPPSTPENARFDRDASTGVLTYRDCITGATRVWPIRVGHLPPDSARESARQRLWARCDFLSLVMSADGKSVYGTSLHGLVRFDRDRTTGAIAYKGCITGNASSGPVGLGSVRRDPRRDAWAGRLSGFNPVTRPVARTVSPSSRDHVLRARRFPGPPPPQPDHRSPHLQGLHHGGCRSSAPRARGRVPRFRAPPLTAAARASAAPSRWR